MRQFSNVMFVSLCTPVLLNRTVLKHVYVSELTGSPIADPVSCNYVHFNL